MIAYTDPQKPSKTNIMVSLKSKLLCESLCRAMGREANGYRMFAAHSLQPPADFRPDVIIIDSSNLHQELHLKWPESKLLLVDTGLLEEDAVRLMCSYKLYGIISPEADFQQFRKALHVIQDGQIWIDNAKLKAILHGKSVSQPARNTEKLSKKETRIIELVAEGCKNKEIASKLFLSEQTIKSHLGRIFKKMHVTNRSQLVSLTIRNKIPNQ